MTQYLKIWPDSNPLVPMRPAGDATDAVASTAFVQQAVLAGGGGGGASSVSSVFGRVGAVTARFGDYFFAQIGGSVAPNQLPLFTAGGNGAVPGSGGGTANFLRADGAWVPPLTVSVPLFTAATPGIVPASGGGPVNFLRADGTWTAPPSGPVGAVGPVNVNTLAATPLVGDGATANYDIWQSMTPHIQALSRGWPVPVTLTAGSPCVVTPKLNPGQPFHGFKPNQAFKFVLDPGGALPPELDTNTFYYITIANLTGTTLTFTTVNNHTFVLGQPEGAPVTASDIGLGVNIVPYGSEWIELYVPPGVYATQVPLGSAPNRRQVAMLPVGLSRVRVHCYGAVFDDLFVPTAGGTVGVVPQPAPIGWTVYAFDFIDSTSNQIQSPTVYPIYLKDPAGINKYYVGEWIWIGGLDLMNEWRNATSYPPSPHYGEYNQIVAIDPGPPVALHLKFPMRFKYLDTWPEPTGTTDGTGTAGDWRMPVGPAIIYPMGPQWDMDIELIGARNPFGGGSAESFCRKITFTDCVFDTSAAPTVGRDIRYRNCKFPNATNLGGVSPYVEIDKMMEYVEFENCEGILAFQSTSLTVCGIKGHRGIIGYTPRNMHIEDSILDSFTVGVEAFGCTDSVVMKNCRCNFFGAVAGYYLPLQGAWNAGMTILANWQFANGTLSRDLAAVPVGATSMLWMVVGGKYFLCDEAGGYANLGSPFSIVAIYMTGSVLNLDTTLRAIPARQTSSQVGQDATTPPGSWYMFPATQAAPPDGTPVLFKTTGFLPASMTADTTVYFVVNSGGYDPAHFQVAERINGTPLDVFSSAGSGTHTMIINPLHICIHPCPRFTGIGNTGTQTVIDQNGLVDEPVFSRYHRSLVARQVTFEASNFQAPMAFLWGTLVSMTVNVAQAGSSGTLAVTCPGFTQPDLSDSPFSQTIDLTVAGKRVVTPAGVTGAAGADVLTAYGDWLSSGTWSGGPPGGGFDGYGLGFNAYLQIVPSNTPTNLSDNAVVEIEIRTDQGITRMATMFGADTQTNSTAINVYLDSSIQSGYPVTP